MNKRTIYLLFLGLFLASCGTAQKTSDTPPPPPPAAPAPVAGKTPFVTWDKKFLELGKVKKGETRSFTYEFTNTSAETIKIDIVDACECTKVDWPRRSIAPGEKGLLKVVFDSASKDAAETIGINIVFANLTPEGNPRFEMVEYHFDLE